MAVLVVSGPSSGAGIFSANNPMVFVVASALSGSTDYIYVADLYVNTFGMGAYGTTGYTSATAKITTMKVFPDPVTGYGVFNIQGIVNKLVAADFPGNTADEIATATLIHECLNGYRNISIGFREQYTSGSTFYAPTGSTTFVQEVPVINSSMTYKQNLLYPTSLYTAGFTSASRFYTNVVQVSSTPNVLRTMNLRAPKTLRQWLYFGTFNVNGTNAAQIAPFMHIITYNSSGGTVGTYYLGVQASPKRWQRGWYVGVGYPQLAQSWTSGFTAVSGTLPVLGPTVTRYAVFFNNVATSFTIPTTRDLVYYTIDDECTKFTATYSLYWLNCLGGFESMRFALKNVTTHNKTTASYKKTGGTLGSNGVFTYKDSDQYTVPYFTEVDSVIQLNSDFLSDADCLNLKDMFSSPVVYLEDSDGFVHSVNVDNKNFKILRNVNGDRPNTLQINVSIGAPSYRQEL